MTKGKAAEEIPALQNGEAFVWPAGDAPPTKTRIPTKRTFHPDRKAAKAAAIAETRKTDVSAFVATMRDSLQALTKEAQENDPKALRAEIARLRVEASKKQFTTVTVDAKPDPAALEDAKRQGYAEALIAVKRNALDRLQTLAEALTETIDGAVSDVNKTVAQRGMEQLKRYTAPPTPAPARAAAAPRIPQAPSLGLTSQQQRVLDALAWWGSVGVAAPDKGQVGFLAGYRVGKNVGGTFGNVLGQLRSLGLIDYPSPGNASLTQEGKKVARAPTEKPTTAALQQAIRDRLDGPEARVLGVLIESYPDELSKQTCGERAGYAVGDNVGGTFGNILGRLRSLGLIDYPSPGRVVALPVLFLHG
jgi:hypothetical protein